MIVAINHYKRIINYWQCVETSLKTTLLPLCNTHKVVTYIFTQRGTNFESGHGKEANSQQSFINFISYVIKEARPSA